MLRVCMAQINTTVGDLEGNTRRICEAIDRSRDLGTDLICFPELSIPGYPPEDLLLKPDFVRGNLAALEEVTRRTTDIAVVVGFVDQGTHLYNAAAVCVDGERVGIYYKQRLPNYGVFDEKRYFHPGRRAPVFIIEGVPVGVTICEDIWAPGGACQAEAAAGALVIININGSPYHAGKRRDRGCGRRCGRPSPNRWIPPRKSIGRSRWGRATTCARTDSATPWWGSLAASIPRWWPRSPRMPWVRSTCTPRGCRPATARRRAAAMRARSRPTSGPN